MTSVYTKHRDRRPLFFFTYLLYPTLIYRTRPWDLRLGSFAPIHSPRQSETHSPTRSLPNKLCPLHHPRHDATLSMIQQSTNTPPSPHGQIPRQNYLTLRQKRAGSLSYAAPKKRHLPFNTITTHQHHHRTAILSSLPIIPTHIPTLIFPKSLHISLHWPITGSLSRSRGTPSPEQGIRNINIVMRLLER
ncbi:hypothetical protein P280DRAFT_154043 [Massarina eburnea CBS 473.64]|uniref:Uncharacterized protein n=1 Tax=Massarina eburnea CBS 473.64 TaxID=1395130 RepID=A0A6A6RM99_9PLEO|nr:hypothetical protein P280DRAFT_154043 [Massarina eburnea CBS 473.64]